MPELRESTTFPVERNVTWRGDFVTEAAEAAWASEAIFFIRALAGEGLPENCRARVQISPDGMHWCDEGTEIPLPVARDGVTFCRLSHFGGWLRLVGELPPGAALTVIVYLVLKA